MIARITGSNMLLTGRGRSVVGISPEAVVVTIRSGVDATTPIVGISPASTETERVQVAAMANMKRFMGVAPYLPDSGAS